jgi:hypothetical protein
MKDFWKFIIGILSFGLLHFVVYSILFSYTFEFLSCGDDFLNDRLQHNVLFLTLFGLVLGQAFVSWKLIKALVYKASGIAGLIFIMPSLYFSFLIGPKGLLKSNYYTEFSKETWGNQSNRSEEMIRYIINEEILIGMSREEVKAELGQPAYYSCAEDSCFVYHSESAYLPLKVEFVHNQVTETHVICVD